MESQPIEMSALGRPLFPGMLYDCRRDSFIPGVTLWDKKSLSEDLDTRAQLQTDLKFSSSDSISEKSNLLDVSASLKASFLGGLIEVGGSAKFLRDTKSSNQQSRVTVYYSETSRFEQLTMTHLDKITYPQVFDQKTATHVVTAVLYGAQAFMLFDRTSSQEENKQEIQGELYVMVKKIPLFSVEGKGSVQMSDGEKQMADNISCTFYGDFHLKQNPTTYMEALDLYKKLPTLLTENPQNAVPVKVWLYPLHLLDTKAAQLLREVSTSLVSDSEYIIEELGEVERTCNDLSRNSLVNVFRDLKERVRSFEESFSIYKTVLQKALARVLPAIRGGGMEEEVLAEILKIHYDSPFNTAKLKQWLEDAKSELLLLSSYTKMLKEIKVEDSDRLITVLLDPDVDFVVCFTFTSLNEDPCLESLKEFLKSDRFKELDENKVVFSMPSVRKWFSDPVVVIKMRKHLSHFKSFAEANKHEKKICFIISAIPDSSSPGSSIYLYEKGKLTNTQFQPVSKPPPPIVKKVMDQTVSLKLQKSPTGETLKYRVEYKQVKADSGAEEPWLFIDTADEDFTLTGLKSGEQYLVRYRIISKVGVSEASDTVSHISSAQPVIVGGKEGCEVTFMTPSISTIKKISIYYVTFPEHQPSVLLTGIQMIFNTGHMFKTDTISEKEGFCWNEKEFIFDNNDKIIAATLWPSDDQERLAGLEFVVAKSSGTSTTLSFKCSNLGQPVSVDVKSGKCYGTVVKSEIGRVEMKALGFYFI